MSDCRLSPTAAPSCPEHISSNSRTATRRSEAPPQCCAATQEQDRSVVRWSRRPTRWASGWLRYGLTGRPVVGFCLTHVIATGWAASGSVQRLAAPGAWPTIRVPWTEAVPAEFVHGDLSRKSGENGPEPQSWRMPRAHGSRRPVGRLSSSGQWTERGGVQNHTDFCPRA